uniref:Fatty-acid and retinol-binding protein 1 n=1 Tax=Steinernema glaseri TaxID=37863 RepID=A0A1I7XYF0_9BILA
MTQPIMIHRFLPLLLVAGVAILATAKPISRNDLESAYPVKEDLTRERFAELLRLLPTFTDIFKHVIFPKEFIAFLRTISNDDYEAIKYAFEIVQEDPDIVNLVKRMEEKFPEIHERFMVAVKNFSKRWDALSLDARRSLVTAVFLRYRLQNAMEFLRIMAPHEYYRSIPQDVVAEIDELFPKLSTTVKMLHEEFDVSSDEQAKIKEVVDLLLACEDLTANKCGAYKKALESGNSQDVIPFLGNFTF